MKGFVLWSAEALARSLHLALLVGLIDAGNDNGRPLDRARARMKAADRASDRFLYVFVDLHGDKPDSKPDVYVVPSGAVKAYCGGWAKTAAMVRWHPKVADVDGYKNRWDAILHLLAGEVRDSTPAANSEDDAATVDGTTNDAPLGDALSNGDGPARPPSDSGDDETSTDSATDASVNLDSMAADVAMDVAASIDTGVETGPEASVEAGVDSGFDAGLDTGIVSEAGTSHYCLSTSSTACECLGGVSGNGTPCGTAQVGGTGLCCAQPGWPTTSGQNCTCEAWGCSASGSPCVCSWGSNGGPPVSCAPTSGTVCCASGSECECLGTATCSGGWTQVSQCNIATVTCDSPTYVTVSACQ